MVTKTVVVELGRIESVPQNLIDGGNFVSNTELRFFSASRAIAGIRLAPNLTPSPRPRGAIFKGARPLLRNVEDTLFDLYGVQRFVPTDVSRFFPRDLSESSPCSAT